MTAKKLSEMIHLKPNTLLYLSDIPEVFNAADFCNFVKKGFCKEIKIEFVQNVSSDYRTNFVNNIMNMKRTWNSEIQWPQLCIDGVKY